jgi:uncharacterized protein YjbI with pentapeptide repeats
MTARVRRYFTNIGDRDVMLILLGFFAGAITFSLISHLQGAQANLWSWADSLFQNFGTEMFGAFLTFLLIEVLVTGRRQRESEAKEAQQRKGQLLIQMRSEDSERVLLAINELRLHGWHKDGTLRGAALQSANLERAILREANLDQADLRGAALRWADLRGASLRGALLDQADFSGANLERAQMGGAALGYAEFDEGTTLPDGSKWTPETDTGRFTDPSHEHFWQPG